MKNAAETGCRLMLCVALVLALGGRGQDPAKEAPLPHDTVRAQPAENPTLELTGKIENLNPHEQTAEVVR
ncbi:MAG: hypothetical protein HQ559_17965 [Lentisphaerae bacterium]|nr:hypothetical protein [Lentisphaerota bacterium]